MEARTTTLPLSVVDLSTAPVTSTATRSKATGTSAASTTNVATSTLTITGFSTSSMEARPTTLPLSVVDLPTPPVTYPATRTKATTTAAASTTNVAASTPTITGFSTSATTGAETPTEECNLRYLEIDVNHTMCLTDVGQDVPLTETDRQNLVDLHNQWRSQVQPSTDLVQKVYWDDEVALLASKWARQCHLWHDSVNLRKALSLPGVMIGQNIARGPGDFNWTKVFLEWVSEEVDYVYGIGSVNDNVVGDYTQVVFGNTTRIGCGQADCGDFKYYACNYAMGQTNTHTPYCEECNTCGHVEEGTGLCDCGGKVCLQHGELDPNTCTCNCRANTGGDICETIICPESDGPLCSTANCDLSPTDCPIICGLCPDCNRTCDNGGIIFPRLCQCQCVDGFRGDTCSDPPCDTSECVNGHQNPITCECLCQPGWVGEHCDCADSCGANGDIDVATCTCICLNNYRGNYCDLPPCTTVCQNGGTVDQSNCGCQCTDGWSGRYCDCDLTCATNGRLDSENCVCNCVKRWRGPTCDKVPCQTICFNGVVNQENCVCECDEGWSGPKCKCDLTCENGGVLDETKCRCNCEGGHRGEDCSLPPCDTTCDNGIVNQENCACECMGKWQGERCDCWKFCQNDGVLDPETCTCNCVNGWRGDLCIKAACRRECVSGTINEDNCECQCNEGWTGLTCDCNRTCDNGGNILPRVCQCQCVDGFRGDTCSDPPCDTSECVNGHQNPFTCECLCQPGWVGENCNCADRCGANGDIDVATCTCNCLNNYRGNYCGLPPCTTVCQNGGTVDQSNCSCQCTDGWSGRYCECPTCENGGNLLKPSPSECACGCVDGYRGPTCNLEPCNTPCERGRVDQTSCQCNCYLGWSGDMCDCDRVCNNGGVLNVADCSCTCTAGFEGDTCRQCRLRCTDPEVLSPATCQCEVPQPCDATCLEGLNLYTRTCVCTPSWVNCGQFDAGNCQTVVEGRFCGSKSNQASCPQACGMCETNYEIGAEEEGGPTANVESTANSANVFSGACGDAPLVDNAEVSIDGVTFMSVAVYICTEGYEAVGVGLTQCEEDGSWLPMEYECVATRKRRSLAGCGTPPDMRSMEVKFNRTSAGSVAQYKCLRGYIETGSGKSTCQSDGIWSIPSLLCKEKPSSWFPLAMTFHSVTPVENLEILTNIALKTCSPALSLQTTSGSEKTLHYTPVIRATETDILGQSALRMTKNSWNTFASSPRPEYHSFSTNGAANVVMLSNEGTTQTDTAEFDLVWWYKIDSCLKPIESNLLNFVELLAGGVAYTNKEDGNGRMSASLLGDIFSLIGSKNTPQSCIDTCWHAIRNKREVIEGVTRGHDLMVRIDNIQALAQDVIVYNDQVTVTLDQWAPSNQSDSSETEQVLSAARFQGDISQCTYSTQGTSFSVLQRTSSWFMDSRPWSKVLSINGNGTVLYGSKSDLISLISLSKNLRLGVLHINNMRHYMKVGTVVWQDRGEAAAEVTHHPSVELSQEFGLGLSAKCHYWAAIITTEGQYSVYEYSINDGRHETITDIVSIDWFVY